MTTAVETSATLEAKLDALSERVEAIAVEMEIARRRREAMDELRDTLLPIAGEAFTVAGRELEALEAAGTLDEVVGLLRRLIAAAGSLEKAVSALEAMTSLLGEAAPLSGEVVAALTARLAELDDKGYFDFARHSAGVLEKVVTSFDEDDIDALGENVVLILETVKEMTQPQVMQMLRRTATAVQTQHHAIEAGVDDTPSLWQLARRMREPEVRRGLARALNMLRSVAADTPQPRATGTKAQATDTKGDG